MAQGVGRLKNIEMDRAFMKCAKRKPGSKHEQ